MTKPRAFISSLLATLALTAVAHTAMAQIIIEPPDPAKSTLQSAYIAVVGSTNGLPDNCADTRCGNFTATCAERQCCTDDGRDENGALENLHCLLSLAMASATIACEARAFRSTTKPTPQASNSRERSNRPAVSGIVCVPLPAVRSPFDVVPAIAQSS